MPINIPTDLLRTFVTVVDLGGHTRAAKALGRTQPAISLQIRRLEELLRTKLLRSEARQLKLTDAGVALGPYARQMLRLNDDVVAHFANESLSGWIRLGLPTDFSNTFLLEAISGFALANPAVRIEVDSKLSRDLRADLADDRLDIVVAIAPVADEPFLVSAASVTPFWVMAETFQMNRRATLPLIRHPDPCEYADRMRNALRGAGISWRTVMVATDVAGVQAAVRAGLGATALTPATLMPGMRIGRSDEGFPPLSPLRIGLFYKHARLTKAGHGLAQWLIDQVGRAGQSTP